MWTELTTWNSDILRVTAGNTSIGRTGLAVIDAWVTAWTRQESMPDGLWCQPFPVWMKKKQLLIMQWSWKLIIGKYLHWWDDKTYNTRVGDNAIDCHWIYKNTIGMHYSCTGIIGNKIILMFWQYCLTCYCDCIMKRTYIRLLSFTTTFSFLLHCAQ